MDSRIEEILKEKVGDPYEEVPLMSRIEILLDRLSSSGDSSEYAHSLVMSIDSRTYIVYAHLRNLAGEVLGTEQKIDLPLETMVVGGSYDDSTKKVILTLKNGNTVDFSVADLVSGLQSEITSSNKLNSDLVDDTNQNNKFVTSTEKTKIANALTEEVYNAGKQVKTGNNTGEIFNNYTGGTKATGNYSHAEGSGTTATGNYSHAEGSGTTATGNNSHAECGGTTANGDNSHAEGTGTKANGIGSHAEGGATTANGYCSHAEGSDTTATGNYSHAEGSGTTANGRNSHAEGTGTKAGSNNQHVQGKFNAEDSSNKYAFIIGNGIGDDNRSNAFAVDWNGLIYVNNASTGVNVSQLQPIINSSNKISADFIDDSGSPNKFMTVDEKTKLAGLQNYNDASCIKNVFGTSLANGDDLNTYTTAGTYACTSGAVASSLINCPYTGSGFRLDVIQTSSVNFLKQIVQPNQLDTDSSIYHRTYAVSTGTWSAWYKLASEVVSV